MILTAVVVVGVLTVSSAWPLVTLPKFIHSENDAIELKAPHLAVVVSTEPSANTVPSSCRYHPENALPVILATSAARVAVASVVGM
jgi:type III secretory pathway component EscS